MPKWDALSPESLFPLHRQGLIVPLGDSGEVVTRLAAVQAQVSSAAVVQVAARAESVEHWRAALSETRQVVRYWSLRGTLHVTTVDMMPIILAATKDAWFGRWSRFLNRAVGKSREHLVRCVVDALEESGGSATRDMLAQRLSLCPAPGPALATQPGLVGGLLKDACYLGQVLPTGMDGSRTVYTLTRQWCGPVGPGPDREEAVAMLMKWYLAGHGPARVQDFAHWSGFTVTESRRAAARLGREVEPVVVGSGGGGYLVLAEDGEDYGECRRLCGDISPEELPVRLLGEYDDLALAYADSSRFIRSCDRQHIYGKAAHVYPMIVAGGRVVGGWRHTMARRRLNLRWWLFSPEGDERGLTDSVEREAARVACALGAQQWVAEYVEEGSRQGD